MFRFKEEYKINDNNNAIGILTIYNMCIKDKEFDTLDEDYIPKRLYRKKLNLKIKKGLKK